MEDGRIDHTEDIAEQIAQGERRDEAVEYLAAGFTHSDPSVRIHTARTFAVLGGDRAVSHLVAAGPAVPAEALPGGSTRGYAAFLQQQSYIRDFNVEVAQASFIADPVVDVLQSGTVIDVTVHAVVATLPAPRRESTADRVHDSCQQLMDIFALGG